MAIGFQGAGSTRHRSRPPHQFQCRRPAQTQLPDAVTFEADPSRSRGPLRSRVLPLNDLRDIQSLSPRPLLNLSFATEAVGDEKRARCGASDLGKQNSLAACD